MTAGMYLAINTEGEGGGGLLDVTFLFINKPCLLIFSVSETMCSIADSKYPFDLIPPPLKLKLPHH